MLIGFMGNGRHCGKDLAADFVAEYCEAHGLSFKREAFADRPKLLVAEVLGITGTDEERIAQVNTFKLHGQLVYWLMRPGPPNPDDDEGAPNSALTGREFIDNLCGQGLENGARKLFGDTFWVDQVLPYGWTETADFTVITDVRFPPEANRITECKGLVVCVSRPGAEDGVAENLLNSALYADGAIENNGTPDDLRAKVFRMMDSFTAEYAGT